MKDFHRNIAALTGLRGIAALLVASFHFVIAVPGYQPSHRFGFTNVVDHGYLAVDLFFVMSGFVMALSYGHYFRRGVEAAQLGIFMIRRAARIYPLYLAVTLLYIAQSVFRPGLAPWLADRKGEIVANIFMVQSWGVSRSIVEQAWSISTEFAAYILFPFVAAALLFAGPRKAVLCAVLCAVGIVIVSLSPTPADYWPLGPLDIHTDHTGYAVLRCLCGFCLGMITYRIATVAHRKGWQLPPLACYAVTLALLLSQMMPGWDLVTFALMPAFILAVLNDTIVSRILGSTAIVFLGEISYAVYLVHGKVFPTTGGLVNRWFGALHGVGVEWIAFALFMAATMGAAILAHYFCERPARRWIRALEIVFDKRASQTVLASEARGLSDISSR
jgi:peptidoglycan/LPS O-acetylase OafA/YrhL